MKNVSIIIPFKTDHGPREKAFRWVKRYYELNFPDAEICTSDDLRKAKNFNKSIAVNVAAKEATREIFVILDADMIIDPESLKQGIRLLEQHPWIIPYSAVKHLSKESTNKLYKQQPVWPLSTEVTFTKVADATIGYRGGINIVTRNCFDSVNGFDERFQGYGGEDDAFAFSLDTMCGPHYRMENSIIHLWHPPILPSDNPHYRQNFELTSLYEKALGNPTLMKKLIEEKINKKG